MNERKFNIKPSPEESQETKKEFGKNIHFKIFFYRHGEKEGEMLAPKGYEQAKEIGLLLEPQEVIKGYGSEFERAQDFSRTIVEATQSQKQLNLRTRLDL